jgi:hypothetical protein
VPRIAQIAIDAEVSRKMKYFIHDLQLGNAGQIEGPHFAVQSRTANHVPTAPAEQ